MSADESTERPVLRIVRGAPSAEDVAALVAVVAAASASGGSRPRTAPASAGWAAHEHTVRGPLAAGGWRASAAPR